ncbi:hypothetical protein Lser_V15G06091 [Lactuca serriola]
MSRKETSLGISHLVEAQSFVSLKRWDAGQTSGGSALEALYALVLVILFLVQKFGTARVSFLFSPIMGAWTLTTPLIGIYNIIYHYPSIFKAISPHYIYQFFLRNGHEGWLLLNGMVLCITGAIADSRRKGFLGFKEFITAIQLISMAQVGHTLSSNLLNSDVKKKRLKGDPETNGSPVVEIENSDPDVMGPQKEDTDMLEEPLEAKSSTPLPVLYVEDGNL